MSTTKNNTGVLLTTAILCATLSAFLCSWALEISFYSALPIYFIFAVISLAALGFRALQVNRMRRINSVELFMLAFLCWCAISVLWSINWTKSVYQLNNYFQCFLVFVLASRLGSSESGWRSIGWGIVFGCIVASSIVYMGGIEYSSGGDGEDRSTIGKLNSNYVAYCIATSIPAALALLSVKNGRAWIRVLLYCYLIFASVALVYAGSRAALFAVLMSIALFLLVNSKKNFLKTSVLTLSLGVIAYVVYSSFPEYALDRLASFGAALTLDTGSIDLTGREDIWPYAIEAIRQNAIAGVGVGSFPFTNPMGLYAHNTFLSVAAETGAIGCMLYFSIVWQIFNRAVWKTQNRVIRLAGLLMMLTWLIVSLTGVWEAAALAWFSLGWIYGGARCDLEPAEKNLRARRFRFVFR